MRLVAHGPTLRGERARMRMALAGLSLRGHEVTWLAPGPLGLDGLFPGVRHATVEGGTARSWRDVAGLGADLIVGGARTPLTTALAGWLAGASVLLLDLDRAAVEGWRWIDRWGWGSLYGAGLVDEQEADRWAANPRGLARERIGLWPSAGPPSAPDPAHPDTEVLERACERALARHRGGAARPAVFLDRDGTLVRETGYLSDPDGLDLLPGVVTGLRELQAADLPLVVISNQSGIGRGMFREADVHAVMARLRRRLRERGVELSAIYFCPHRPEDDCPCRKPRPGLLERAAEDLHLTLAGSVMIGDKRIDAAAGRLAGGSGILVRTGYGREEETKTGPAIPGPDHVSDDLQAAAAWWLQRGSA